MLKRYFIFLKSTGISPYIWTVLSILPFYFIFLSSPSTIEIVFGVILTVSFFVLYRIAYISKGWSIYLWSSILISISIIMTIQFSYVYFAFFNAYLIGNKKNRVTFLTLYIIHLVITTISINLTIIFQEDFMIKQLPFVVITWISVILLPFSIHSRNERGQLEEKLVDANKRISDLVKLEERQRIARDLHDTLGQRLSLIGLKSDLARKLITKDPEQAQNEIRDVQQTARTALNEVRKIVSQMRGIRIKDEIIRVKQILLAAQIEFECDQELTLTNVSLLTENIVSMCLKEAVTNVVKHSKATTCSISFHQTNHELIINVKDNGIGCTPKENFTKGYGLIGMRERLEFVNGSLDVINQNGTTIIMKVPIDVKQIEKE
ncbi:sensor histidine kinase [Gottfriedia solisilvae]|uniref:histidine kinase n=1 Tax=Gottfriedia solisilvae TaxID=1516104 RepID=A0A8J3AEZ8_9BACI|nr:sensor histidine kinase [Gottfriedia solisilvae]GGI13093.1 sensor histidine kinase DesK [Gottfriedia solisilvae]